MNATETHVFLHELFDGKPSSCAIQIWHRINERKSVNVYKSSIDAAALVVQGCRDQDCYVAAGLAPKELARSSVHRLSASGVVGIPGVWADIDVNGGPEGKTGAATDVRQALELAHSLLIPSLVINSGYGVQAWWLFEDGPWMFPNEQQRDHAGRLSQAFQGALKAQARRMGFSLDSTHDLARLMRVPGSFNHKGTDGAPVLILEREGSRYNIDQIGELSHTFLVAGVEHANRLRTGQGVQIEIRGDAEPPLAKLEELMDIDDDFKRLWRKTGWRKTADWSHSQFEMAITNMLVMAGWSDQEIADTLVYYRNKYESGDPRHKNRADRIAQTIGKVRADREVSEINSEMAFERDQAADHMESMSRMADPPDKVRTISLFNRIIGGPEIAELRQSSRDPDQARFSFVLADGGAVSIGKFNNLADQRKFREIYGVVTQHFFEMVKGPKWDAAVAVLLRSATVTHEEGEDTVLAELYEWLEMYLDRGGSRDRNAAIASREPFRAEAGGVHLHVASFAAFVNRLGLSRVESPDLRAMLRVAGFERRTINYRTPEGAQSSRSYMVGAPPAALLVEGVENVAPAT